MASYGKKPLWQWIVIYAVIAVVVYGAVYYFFFASKGGYNNTVTAPSTNNQTNPGTSASSLKNTVGIENFAYSPSTITVKVGDSVTWTNKDGVGHSATADDNSFNTGVLSQNQSGSVTFSKAGTYPYHCSVHPSMHGTVIVQ